MIISPMNVILNSYITHPDCRPCDESTKNILTQDALSEENDHPLLDWTAKKFIDSNTINFTLDGMKKIDVDSPVIVTEKEKNIRKLSPIVESWDPIEEEYLFEIPAMSIVIAESKMCVELPSNVSCLPLTIHPTFMRLGLALIPVAPHTGNIEVGLQNLSNTPVIIGTGMRVGQICFQEVRP